MSRIPPYEMKPYKRKIDLALTDRQTGRVKIKTIKIEHDDLEKYRDFVRVECIEAAELLFDEMFE